MRVFRWRPQGWEEKELPAAVSFSTAAESFDSNPPPGVLLLTAPSFTDSSVELECGEEGPTEGLIPRGQEGQDHGVSSDPWLELAGEEKRPENPQGTGAGERRVRWADGGFRIPANWACFKSFTLPVSYGCEPAARKTVRFASPLSEDLAPVKRTARARVKKALGTVKAKLVCGAPHC